MYILASNAMSYVLNKLSTKNEVDNAIRHTEDKLLVLRFGRESEAECMKLDDIVSAKYTKLPSSYKAQEFAKENIDIIPLRLMWYESV